jgi:hypothetical protein
MNADENRTQGTNRPRLIPAPGEPITHEQAAALLDLYGEDAGEIAAGVAATLQDRGRAVHFWKVLTVDELVRTWNAPSDVALLALVHYAPSQAVPFDSVQVRLDRSAGELLVWDGRGVLP